MLSCVADANRTAIRKRVIRSQSSGHQVVMFFNGSQGVALGEGSRGPSGRTPAVGRGY